MARQFLANLSFLVILNIVIKPLYILGIEVSVQNAVGTQSYGLYFAILNSAYLLQILNDFGLQIFNNRKVALDSAYIQGAFRSILRLKGILTLLYFVMVLALMAGLGYLDHLDLIIPVAINLVLVSMVLWLRSNVSGLGFYKTDSALSVMDKSLMILICGALLLNNFEGFTIYHFVYSQMAALAATALVAIIILYRKGVFSTSFKPPKDIVKLIREAWPFALAVFLMTMYTRVDAVMIEQIAENGEYESGLYAAGYRLFDAANMFAFLFAVLLLPMFTKLLSKRDELVELVSIATRMVWFITVTVAVFGIMYAEQILQLLYTDSDPSWVGTFQYLIASYIAVGLMYVHGTMMTAVGNMTRLNIAYASCVLLNIVVNIIMIPRLGAEGAAIATLITQSCITIILILFSSGYLNLRFNWLSIVGALLFAGVLAGGVYGASTFLSLHWILEVCILLPCALIIALFTRVVLRNDLRALIAK